jgi:hypothetical protein
MEQITADSRCSSWFSFGEPINEHVIGKLVIIWGREYQLVVKLILKEEKVPILMFEVLVLPRHLPGVPLATLVVLLNHSSTILVIHLLVRYRLLLIRSFIPIILA